MQNYLGITIFVAGLLCTHSALALDGAYQPEDEILMQQCFETVHDINADPENTKAVSYAECIGVASAACQDEKPENSSTLGMVNCTAREISWWDDQLNFYYADLRDSLDAEEFDKLRDAQRAWIAYRDAKCEFEYFYWREGTIRSIFGISCSLEETARRAIDLADVLDWMDT